MFVQIVITKTEAGSFKITYFDEGGVVHTERMTDQQIADTIFTSLQNLRTPKL